MSTRQSPSRPWPGLARPRPSSSRSRSAGSWWHTCAPNGGGRSGPGAGPVRPRSWHEERAGLLEHLLRVEHLQQPGVHERALVRVPAARVLLGDDGLGVVPVQEDLGEPRALGDAAVGEVQRDVLAHRCLGPLGACGLMKPLSASVGGEARGGDGGTASVHSIGTALAGAAPGSTRSSPGGTMTHWCVDVAVREHEGATIGAGWKCRAADELAGHRPGSHLVAASVRNSSMAPSITACSPGIEQMVTLVLPLIVVSRHTRPRAGTGCHRSRASRSRLT